MVFNKKFEFFLCNLLIYNDNLYKETVIKAVIIFAEGIFKGESYVV